MICVGVGMCKYGHAQIMGHVAFFAEYEVYLWIKNE